MINSFILVIFGLAGFLAVAALLLLIVVKPARRSLSRDKFAALKQSINQLSRSDSLIDLQQGVVEGDKLLDEILKTRVQGENLGQRLKNAKHLFASGKNYQAVWTAHKLRNSLVHDVHAKIEVKDCYRAIKIFLDSYKWLGY